MKKEAKTCIDQWLECYPFVAYIIDYWLRKGNSVLNYYLKKNKNPLYTLNIYFDFSLAEIVSNCDNFM